VILKREKVGDFPPRNDNRMLSTLITGLDGRSNFERNGGALAPLLHPSLAHFLYNR
jgi:hypothetical protein